MSQYQIIVKHSSFFSIFILIKLNVCLNIKSNLKFKITIFEHQVFKFYSVKFINLSFDYQYFKITMSFKNLFYLT